MNVLITCCLTLALFLAEGLKLYPVDESDGAAGLREFKNALLVATEHRDTAFLQSILAPEVGMFSGDATPQQVLRAFSEDPTLWRDLHDSIGLGVTQWSNGWCAPYVFTELKKVTDAPGLVAIVGKDVRVHTEPKSTAPVIAVLSYDVIKPGFLYNDSSLVETIGNQTYQWREIITPNGKSGYVWGKYVRSDTEVRFCFSNDFPDGNWKLTGFAEGD